MHYVYLLESKAGGQRYIGVTTDLKRRLVDHNSGKSSHTSKFCPGNWSLMLRFQITGKPNCLNVI
jgi:predicted GIY-YIG superfamily endonuclease